MLFDDSQFNTALSSQHETRHKIRKFYRLSESEVLDDVLPKAMLDGTSKSRAWDRARQLVINIREQNQGQGGIDALLSEFSLSSEEGVVLMCLAEALLRVPDANTQDRLIRDKLATGDWSSHLGNSDSLFVNASSWGLLLTGKMVNYSDEEKHSQFGILKRTVGSLGEPVIRRSVQFAMKIMGKQFVMGRSIEEALERAIEKESKGYTYSYDMLGEGARTMADADQYFESYKMAIHAIGKAANGKGTQKSPGISVKLSAIHPRYEFSHYQRVMHELVPRLLELVLLAKHYDIGFTIDAEEADRLDISLDIFECIYLNDKLGHWNGLGLAVQAYQKRAIHVIDWVTELSEQSERKIMVRLVKGAYWDTEIKSSQQDGLSDYPVFTRKASTDVSYQSCAKKLMQSRETIFPQFATHNAYTAAIILEMADGAYDNFEFQRLHGMGELLYDQIVEEEKVQCRVYAPVGQHQDLLAYLVRRLLENGANSSFVNAIVDESKTVESLLIDPIEKIGALKSKANPSIQLPKALFGKERDNSEGIDLTDIDSIIPLKKNLQQWLAQHLLSDTELPNRTTAVINPANHREVLGHLTHHDEIQMQQLIENAEEAFINWSSRPMIERAGLLRQIANVIESNRDELIALCIKEAGKIAQDGVDEVREAVDFCRYYAARAVELAADHRLEPRGVVLCISPWNFPLAIFLGQVAAAIVTGNTVIAKAAEQTSLIAIRTIELMHSAGLPENVVASVIARGSLVGKYIIPDYRIKAVMFTGSTTTGTQIAQTLAARGGEQLPLIAETGGQNCMIVDSTALPEQVVDDVISSGFQSAGQRCSALRVLFIQEDIADSVINMVKGAMAELTIGDPSKLSTDVGPVIDQKALESLNSHVEYLKDKATLHYQCKLEDVSANEHFFFAPRLYEIDSLSVLKEEVFGPCVHVIRFNGNDLEDVIHQINATGFGLTMGIHTRIEGRADRLAELSNAGNIYINRNMIGAVVGVQPFGGRGLSGTGPKAGGPSYLLRLLREKEFEDNLQSTEQHSVELNQDYPAAQQAQIDESVEQLFRNNDQCNKMWRETSLNDRISSIRQLLAKLAQVDSMNELTDDLEQSLVDARAQLNQIENQISRPLTLPGPTGESNKLYFEPRGLIVCYADKDTSFNFWLISMVSALATGNTVVTVVSDYFYNDALALMDKFLATGVQRGILQVAKLDSLKTIIAHKSVTAVIIGSGCENKSFVNTQLAAREGAILPVISAEYYDTLIRRLQTEKTVSIDTTASGGNTSLMTLDA